jgi:hypothetical protein
VSEPHEHGREGRGQLQGIAWPSRIKRVVLSHTDASVPPRAGATPTKLQRAWHALSPQRLLPRSSGWPLPPGRRACEPWDQLPLRRAQPRQARFVQHSSVHFDRNRPYSHPCHRQRARRHRQVAGCPARSAEYRGAWHTGWIRPGQATALKRAAFPLFWPFGLLNTCGRSIY